MKKTTTSETTETGRMAPLELLGKLVSHEPNNYKRARMILAWTCGYLSAESTDVANFIDAFLLEAPFDQ